MTLKVGNRPLYVKEPSNSPMIIFTFDSCFPAGNPDFSGTLIYVK